MGFNADVGRAKRDCTAFGERYFQHLLTQATAPFHRELIGLAEVPEHDRLSILAPRGHAKSTWLSIIYPIWKIVREPDIRMLMISDTEDQAMLLFQAVKDELLANERLIADYGAFYEKTARHEPNRWAATWLKVAGTSRAKEPTLACAGTGKRIVGRRADLIIVDDPLNDELADTDRQRRKTLRWFRKTLTPILAPDTGRMIVIGTRKHPEDLHRELGRNPRWTQRTFRALGEDGRTPLWPERWPLGRLMREKEEIGSLVFAQEYQNEPVSEETAFFRREWIEGCWRYDRTFDAVPPRDWPVFSGWDLAIVAGRERAAERDTDYTVGVTLALDPEGNRHVLDIYRERGLTTSETLATIRLKAERYRPVRITIENNLFQRLIETTDLPVAGHTTGREKMDVYRGVPSLSVLFENGKYRLPCGDERCRAMTDALTGELVGLGIEAHDDMVMALWICECGIREHRERLSGLTVIDDPTM